MQFRERSKVIQVIRTVYDPAIKRGRAEVVARLDRLAPALDDTVRMACSPAEVAEIEAFLAQRAEMMSLEAKRTAAESLAAHMRLAEAYFTTHPNGTSGMTAADIYVAWEHLKKAMQKAGFRKAKENS
jgi:tRNA1(Val) A37 N6-methylase TrmN6